MFHGWLEVVVEFLNDTAFYAYLIVFVIGLALGGLSSMVEFVADLADDIGGDGDAWGHQQVGLSPVSPLMLAIFGMLFGLTGMSLTAFTTLTTGLVLLATIVVAVALDAGVYFGLFNFFVKSQSTSLAHTQEAVGTHATGPSTSLPATRTVTPRPPRRSRPRARRDSRPRASGPCRARPRRARRSRRHP